MAITGRFEADFQNFFSAVDRANAKLTDFQSGAGRVETSLNRMVDAFSGRRLIQEVTLSTEAVSRLKGGIRSLTDTELQQLAAKATEAVAKMKAMGIEVPPQISKMADQLRPVNDQVKGIGEKVFDLTKGFAAAFAVEKVIEFVLEIGKAQQSLSRLATETQINVSDLQDLTAATAGYGLSNDELAKALYNVSKGIAGGDESVARGLHEAGLSLEELKDKHGKELFLEIEGGLAKLQGSLRDTAAADIFGSKLGAAMAGFAQEANGAVEAAGRLNTKLSAEEVEKLKRYADEVEHLQRNFGTLKDKIVSGGIDTIHSLGLRFREGSAAVRDFFIALTGGTGTNLKELRENTAAVSADIAKSVEAQNRLTDGIRDSASERSKESQAIQFLAALRLDAAKQLEPYQRRGLDDLRDMGQLNQQNASAIGVSVDQFKQYVEQVRAADAATKLLTSATAEQAAQIAKINADVSSELTKRLGTQTQIELAELQKRQDAEIRAVQQRAAAEKASLEQQHADTKENLAKIDDDAAAATKAIQGSFDKLRNGVGVDWDEIRSHSQATLDDIRDRAQKTYVEAFSNPAVSREELDKLLQKYREAAFAATRAGQAQAAGQQMATDAIKKTNESLVEQFSKQQDLLEIERTRAQSSSFDVTAANFDRYTPPSDLGKDSILTLLKQGFSIANAIDVLRAQKRGQHIDISQWPIDARGPRVPGFEGGVQNWAGGKAIIGEHGPEVLDLPSGANVTPMRNARFGGVSVYAPTYVSGVFDPYARHALTGAVGDSIMRRVLAARVA